MTHDELETIGVYLKATCRGGLDIYVHDAANASVRYYSKRGQMFEAPPALLLLKARQWQQRQRSQRA